MEATIFETTDLTYSTPTGRRLQEGLSFTLNSGQMLLISGSNGCGKSTLLKTLLQQFPIERGTVKRTVSDAHIEYIPQLENTEIHLPLTLKDVLHISLGKKLDIQEIVKLGLLTEEQLSSAWNTASGGERKRTLLTRALLRHPRMLVFDEPMNHLDTESRGIMIAVMSKFLKRTQSDVRAIVMVCHQGIEKEEESLFDLLHLNLDQKNPVGRA